MKVFRVLLLVIAVTAQAQEAAWQTLSTTEGLSQGMIFQIIQDRSGFIWVATKDGLNRFDGYNFKVFTHDPYDPYSLSGNHCTSLLEDSKGRIWVGTMSDGVNVFDPLTQRFYHAQILGQGAAAKPSLGKGSVTIAGLEEISPGVVRVHPDTPFNLLIDISLKNDYPPQADVTDSVQYQTVRVEDYPLYIHDHLKQGRVGAFKESFYGVRVTDHVILMLTASNLSPPRRGEIVGRVFIDNNFGGSWFNIRRFILYWPTPSKLSRVITIPEGSGDGYNLSWSNKHTVAIRNRNYLWLYNEQELLKHDSLSVKDAYITLPSDKEINGVIQDHNGNIWAGTTGYGVIKLNPLIKQFRSYLPKNSPSLLFQDRKGNTYFHNNYFSSFHFHRLNSTNNSMEGPLAVSGVQLGIYQDRHGHFWMINAQNNQLWLLKYSEDWQLLKQYVVPDGSCLMWAFVKMVEDRNGLLWLGLSCGKLVKFNPDKEQFSVLNYQHLLPQQGALTQAYSLYQDHQQTFWIGTQHGLVRVKAQSPKPEFALLSNSPTNRQSLSNDFVSCAIDDPHQPNQYLWVSTKGGGVERLNKQTSQFEHFTEKQGLPNKVVYGLLIGDDQHLWMSTNRGIAKLNTQTLVFTNFNKADGLQDDEFNTHSYFRAPSGELLFGGINGITIFRASALRTNKKQPVIRMIGLRVNNQPIEVNDASGLLTQAIEYLPEIELTHDQNQLSLEFSLMDFTNPAKNRYRYQLAGIDDDWVEAGTNHIANFAQLPSGTYTFRVMGTANGESWSKPIDLTIRVRPPLYRTWWAYMLYVSVITYLAYRWYQVQLNRARLQNELRFKDQEAERLAELDTLKTNFFANISHEFRTPLTLILGPMEQIVQDYAADSRFPMIRRNAERLLSLINQLLDISKLEAKEMQPEVSFLDVANFFRTFSSSFSSLASSRQITFEITQNQTEAWGYLDVDKTEKIITNLLSNAFKFTPQGGSVAVSVQYRDPVNLTENQPQFSDLVIEIKDTGIGIKAEYLDKIFNRFYQVEADQKRAYEGTGIGLALVNELVHVLKGSVEVRSQEQAGTTFVVRLPLLRSALGEVKVLEKQPNPLTSFLAQPVRASEASMPTENINQNVLLIIDDNDDIRAYIRSIFAAEYYVIEAQDGQEGLQKAIEQIPDLIISDLMMPNMDGFAFCRAIKTSEKTSHIPVVMLTAKATVESRIEGFDLGADDYLTKPFHPNEIQVRVRNLLRQREQLRRYFTGQVSHGTETEPAVVVSEMDRVFLEKARQVVDAHIANSAFGVEQMSDLMNMSTRQLVRKLKALTNQTTVEFIRNHRLERAAEQLRLKTGIVSEIAYQLGFESMPYFAKVFQEKYGIPPSEYAS